MKYRNGFVTNSSSTSFIISTKDAFSKKTFMNSIGADGDSPMNRIFENLFEAIESDKQTIQEASKDSESVEKFLQDDGYDAATVSCVMKLLEEGREVYYGRLYSDGLSAAEIFFCCDSFLLCEEDIYFNGNIGGW